MIPMMSVLIRQMTNVLGVRDSIENHNMYWCFKECSIKL